MTVKMMNAVLANELVVITSWEDQEMYSKEGFTLYDPQRKIVLGRGTNFLADVGANEESIKLAFEYTVNYYATKLLSAGLEVISTEREKKNGTIVLKQLETERFQRRLGGKSTYETYKIYANGQIRQMKVNSGNYYTTRNDHYRMTSPKPCMVAEKPVYSMVCTYDAAMCEVLKKYDRKKYLLSKKLAKEAVARKKFDATFK